MILELRLDVFQFMLPFNYTEYHDIVLDLHSKQLIPDWRIDDAVSRILRVKFLMGLFENPMADYNYVDQLGCQVLMTVSSIHCHPSIIQNYYIQLYIHICNRLIEIWQGRQ